MGFAKSEVAMVLPLPVQPGAGEDAVRFIDLSAYPRLFADLERSFQRDRFLPKSVQGLAVAAAAPLRVVEVGRFEASFVPTQGDFDRLDPRFRLSPSVWKALPGYERYGFAVFKLKPGRGEVHPMAFEFPRVDPTRLFFPTVHVHDGSVHPHAHFDHVLYCQLEPDEARRPEGLEESPRPAGYHVDAVASQGLIAAWLHLYRRSMSGKLPNQDTFI